MLERRKLLGLIASGALHRAGLDATKQLQSMLDKAAGGTLQVPAGTYYLSSTLRIASNTTLRAHGARFVAASTGFAIFKNVNFEVSFGSEKIDHDITFEGGTYDYGSFADGTNHAISIRMARNIIVRDAFFFGGNDATAMLASQNTVVENCHAYGNNNVAYDHWEGPREATVRNCFAYVQGPYAVGIMFTGVGSPGTHLTASHANFENNQIYGSNKDPTGPGIIINADGAGCSTEYTRIVANRIANTGGGIVISGQGENHELRHNTFIDCGSKQGRHVADCLIRISPERYDGQIFGPPNSCVIGDHSAVGCSVSKINVGLMQLTGTGHTVAALSLLRTRIDGVVFWCPSHNNRIHINGPITVDLETKEGVAGGLFAGDESTIIETSDPWRT